MNRVPCLAVGRLDCVDAARIDRLTVIVSSPHRIAWSCRFIQTEGVNFISYNNSHVICLSLMGEAGREPARPKQHPPKACASIIPPLHRDLNSTFGRLLYGNHALCSDVSFEAGRTFRVPHDNSC